MNDSEHTKKQEGEQMKIDSAATRDLIRAKYGSVAAFQRSCGVTHRYFHMIVSGERIPLSNKPSRAGEVVARLKREDLLVELDSDDRREGDRRQGDGRRVANGD